MRCHCAEVTERTSTPAPGEGLHIEHQPHVVQSRGATVKDGEKVEPTIRSGGAGGRERGQPADPATSRQGDEGVFRIVGSQWDGVPVYPKTVPRRITDHAMTLRAASHRIGALVIGGVGRPGRSDRPHRLGDRVRPLDAEKPPGESPPLT